MAETVADLLAPQDWTFPVPIAYGPGRLAEIGAIAARAGMARPLVVTDRGSAGLPFVGALMDHLSAAGLSSSLFAEVAPNPRDVDVPAGCAAYHHGGHDGIIAIGGGSAMDGAKAIVLTAANDFPIGDFDYLKPAPDAVAFPPLICVPTTAGTGAETETTAMVTDTAAGTKYCAWHPNAKVACALLDPELTLGLPRDLTAWTGTDALVHAIEAYCVPAFHPLCDGAALQALHLIWRWLPQAVAEPDNLEARAGMLFGSCLAGIAFIKGLGLVHSISHMVGAEFDTHHGLTNAVLLPAVLRFNAPGIVDRVGPMADAMQVERTQDALEAAVNDVLDRLEIPHGLAALGVTADRAEALAAKAMEDAATATNPVEPTPEELRTLIERALTSAR